MEKVEATGRINACIERVFGYNACVNRMFLNISRWLEIAERERSELLLFVKNSQQLGFRTFPCMVPIIPCSLPREVVGGEHFVLADLLKSILGSFSQEGSTREPQTEIAKGALLTCCSPSGEEKEGTGSEPLLCLNMHQWARSLNSSLLKASAGLEP